MIKRFFYYLLLLLFILSCSDKVTKYKGFIQSELEYLLASDEAKAWERVSVEEDGQIIVPGDCDMDNFLIFGQGQVGSEKPLLYAYNPTICDSLEFCDLHPDFCQADTMLCNANPGFCESFSEGVLYIGSWYAKEPFIQNSRSDTLVFNINNKTESVFVTSISSQYVSFQYKRRTGSSGGIITEHYQFTPQ
jgi:hypothetical protein